MVGRIEILAQIVIVRLDACLCVYDHITIRLCRWSSYSIQVYATDYTVKILSSPLDQQ